MDLGETETSVSSSVPRGGRRCPSVHVHKLTLGNEVLLKLLEELQVEQVIRGEGLLSHHSLHGLDVLTDGVAGILQTEDTHAHAHAHVHTPDWMNTRQKSLEED